MESTRSSESTGNFRLHNFVHIPGRRASARHDFPLYIGRLQSSQPSVGLTLDDTFLRAVLSSSLCQSRKRLERQMKSKGQADQETCVSVAFECSACLDAQEEKDSHEEQRRKNKVGRRETSFDDERDCEGRGEKKKSKINKPGRERRPFVALASKTGAEEEDRRRRRRRRREKMTSEGKESGEQVFNDDYLRSLT